jgi:cell division protein FtsZ
VTRPFDFEGNRRSRSADEGVEELRQNVDALITIPNERLLTVVDPKTSIEEAFQIADEVLHQGIAGISDLITKPGMINLDFADVRTIMRDAGSALMSIGYGSGENRTIDAAKQAIESPLLETSIQGATGVLYSIAGGHGLTLLETSEAAEIIRAAVDEDAEIIYGTTIDESLGDMVRITLIATGFDDVESYGAPTRLGRGRTGQRGQEQLYRLNDRRERDQAPPPRERERERFPERERPRDEPQRPPRTASPAPMLPDDDWEGESSIIRFLRER